MTPEMQLAMYPMFLTEERHGARDDGGKDVSTSREKVVSKWRMKDRMKTTSVALVLCLNIGVDPPDVLKISPCARMQCWINPLSMQPQKALDAIGKALQAQYERWQPRAKYKLQLDPTVEDVKKLCLSCRRNAKNERVLLHYNGHGVPRPTVNGEVWVFNKSYTQYIPLSIYDLQQWTGNPAIYVFDCSGAGLVVNSFLQLAEQGNVGTGPAAAALAAAAAGSDGVGVGGAAARPDTAGGTMPLGAGASECILLAACGAEELLPQSADLPADVFSACLTTPIKIALRWFVSRSILKGDGISVDVIDKIPGQQNNRKTPLGELNWIFTAITDTIAWNVLPRPLFQRLFRQDLLVASLFRNFLLAERIMRANNCAPISCPALPPAYQHPMWHAWDMAVEICLLQMPTLINGDSTVEFTPSPFFTEQLTAFEVWLEHGSERKAPPEQLPIVLQVLLSQSHRLRALVLLGRFLGAFCTLVPIRPRSRGERRSLRTFPGASLRPPLAFNPRPRCLSTPPDAFELHPDMGPWAVDLALSVGIFPYVLKLLQTTAPDLRQILVFIWTKILALDRSCQLDLVKDSGHVYFVRFLDSPSVPSEERAMAAFVLAAIADDHPKGQAACASSGLLQVCLANLPGAASPSGSPLFVRWLCLCMGKLWDGYASLQAEAFRVRASEAVASLLNHPTPDARAAAVYALGALVHVKKHGRPEGGSSAGTVNLTAGESATELSATSGSASGSGAWDGGGETAPGAGAGAAGAEDAEEDGFFGERAAAERAIACHVVPCTADASSLVRCEAAVALARLARSHAAEFQSAATWMRRERRLSDAGSEGGGSGSGSGFGSRGAGMRRRASGSLSGDAIAEDGTTFQSGSPGAYAASASPGTREPGFWSTDAAAAPGDGSANSSPPAGTFASADAARVGGGLYHHVFERLLELAADPSTRVAVAAQKALLATGIDHAHPLLKPALSRAVLIAAGLAEGGSEPEGGGSRPSTAADDGARESRDGEAGGASPHGRRGGGLGGRTASWSQKLSNLSSRLLGSPRRVPSRDAIGAAASTADGDSLTSSASGVNLQRTSSFQRLMSPLSSKMKRTMSTQGGLHASPGRGGGGAAAGEGPGLLSQLSHGGSDHDLLTSPRAGAGVGGGVAGESGAGADALPKSLVFAWSCEHFSRSLLEPSPAAGGGGYYADGDEEDDFFPPTTRSGVTPPPPPSPKRRVIAPNTRLARRRVAEEAARRSGYAGKEQVKLADQIATIELEHGASPSRLLMHPLSSIACISDDKGIVRAWDYVSGKTLNKFHAGGAPGKPTSSLSLVNDLDDALLLCGGGDGSVRVWRDFASRGEETLVTAFRALPPRESGIRVASSPQGSGVGLNLERHPGSGSADRLSDAGAGGDGSVASVAAVASIAAQSQSQSQSQSQPPPRHGHRRGRVSTSAARHRPAVVVWQQQSGCLYAAGDVHPAPLLRVWDMTRELCLESLQMQSPGTCLTAEGALLMAGAADGAVLSYDLRTPARLLSVIQTHRHPVVGILLQPGNTSNLVVTGSVNGEMKFCDLRNAAKPFFTAEVCPKPQSTAGGGALGGGSNAGGGGSTTARPPQGHALTALVAHAHAGVIASGSSERAIKLWDLEGNNVAAIRYRYSVLGQRVGAVRSLAFHPNRLLLLSGTNDATATVYSGEGTGNRELRDE